MIAALTLGFLLGLLAGLRIAGLLVEATRQQPGMDHQARELSAVDPLLAEPGEIA